MTDYLTPKQVANRLNITVRTLRRWRQSGGGPPWMRLEGRIRYQTTDLTAWLDERRGAIAFGRELGQ